MKNKVAVSVMVAAVAGFASSAALADPASITLGNGYGTLAGEHNVSILTGTGANFITFCLEKNEYFNSYTQTLYVKAINTGAVTGGVGGQTSAGFDPISVQTAYLYTQFRNQTLSNYDFNSTGSARVADADALQMAFWYLEDELGTKTTTLFNSLSTQTKNWITEANNSGWTDIGNVRVMNLYKDQAFTQISQDQLYLMPVPEPETYAMMLAGLGMIGFVAGKRRRRFA